jgi:hypothetical protein
MKNHSYAYSGLATAAFLLLASLTLAQTTPGSKPEHPRDASGAQPAAGQNQPAAAPQPNSKSMGSAHATESLTAPKPKGKAKQQNTADHRSGENPLFETKDKTAAKPSKGTSTVEYKDPEDMTTRYRPGNNKTTRIESKSPSSAAPPPQ